MPSQGRPIDYRAIERRRQQAAREVRAKFPSLIEGSSGWHRAMANRLKRGARHA